MVMRIMIIAGETSGELHGSGVVRELKVRHPECEVYGIGGARMRKAGCELIYPVEKFAFMGLVEVIAHLPFIRAAMRRMEELFETRRPDALILIDYPDFNLRVAAMAKRHGVPVLYYISPQIWAWRPGRVHRIVRVVDRMAVVFPFEVELYEKAGGSAEFVGHPLLEVLEQRYDRASFFALTGLDPSRPLIGLLPGSRRQEVSRLMPDMAATIRTIRRTAPDMQAVVGLAPTMTREDMTPLAGNDPSIRMVDGLTYDVMRHSDLLLVASGTATLESACFGTPLFVLYRMSRLSWWAARHLVTIPDIGLVNVVAGRRIAPEFLQDAIKPDVLAREAFALLNDPERLRKMREELAEARHRLGSPGASGRVADMAAELAGWV
jgi:lipid-A-disaccharide synthase